VIVLVIALSPPEVTSAAGTLKGIDAIQSMAVESLFEEGDI
jgi:hypothetical protein